MYTYKPDDGPIEPKYAAFYKNEVDCVYNVWLYYTVFLIILIICHTQRDVICLSDSLF